MTAPTKEALRREALAWRKGLSPAQKEEEEAALLRQLLALPLWQQASLILCYRSTPQELGTHSILAAALAVGKQLALPRCNNQTKTLEFLEYRGEQALLPGPLGLWEPDPTRCPPVTPNVATLCLVPALAADRRGIRLGYGGGWYDRYLAGFPGHSLVLCRESWLLPEQVPADPWDQPVGGILTPGGYTPTPTPHRRYPHGLDDSGQRP